MLAVSTWQSSRRRLLQGSGHTVALLQQGRNDEEKQLFAACGGRQIGARCCTNLHPGGGWRALICGIGSGTARRVRGIGLAVRTGMASQHLPATRLSEAPAPVVLRSRTPTAAVEEPGPDWRRFASALWRFKWVIVLMVAAGIGAAVAATHVLRPVYVSQANVWVDVPDRRGGGGGTDARGPIRQGALLDA